MARALVCQAAGDYLGMADALGPWQDEAILDGRSRLTAVLWRPLLAEGLVGSGQLEQAAAVISSLYRRHRAAEFTKFLARIDKNVPADLEAHMVCDNLATHKTVVTQQWLARHPRFRLRLTHRLILDQPGRAVVRLPYRPDDPPRRA
jgi:hypothetical protein